MQYWALPSRIYGHDGLHFTSDNLDSVFNFPRSKNKRLIKSFLGLVNYFSHSLRVQPLQDLGKYNEKQACNKILRTPECIASFEDIRQAIDECPMLWFLNDYSLCLSKQMRWIMASVLILTRLSQTYF
jgi:hypothetical protein